MITPEQAISILTENVQVLKPVSLSIENACGYVLAEDVISSVDLPLFDQSAMDGYAVKHSDLLNDSNTGLKVVMEIKAGDFPESGIKTGEAALIFTGAPVPEGAGLVIQQEHATEDKGFVKFSEHDFTAGKNIRKKGTLLKKGDIALKKGLLLNPAAIGFLASIGITDVVVYNKPSVSVISTGNELSKPGSVLKKGAIYESNSYTIASAIKMMRIQIVNVHSIFDNRKQLLETVKKEIETADVLITTGGVSVGKYDLLIDIFSEIGITTLFYKVSQKPGKPMFAGMLGNKLIFGLPGNPAAALTCFYEYVYPSIRMMSGIYEPFLKLSKVKLLTPVTKKSDRTRFLKASLSKEGATILNGQDSHVLNSFVMADALVKVPANEIYNANDAYPEVIHLPDL